MAAVRSRRTLIACALCALSGAVSATRTAAQAPREPRSHPLVTTSIRTGDTEVFIVDALCMRTYHD